MHVATFRLALAARATLRYRNLFQKEVSLSRKLFGIFSGTHLTLIICTALLVPKALSAAATYGNVAITDPTTGVAATVDPKARFRVYDTIAGYTNNPSKIVNITDTAGGSGTKRTIYNVPQGNVLLIKSLTFTYYNGTEGNGLYEYLYSGNTNILNIRDSHVSETKTMSFDAPIIAREGPVMIAFNGSTYGLGESTFIQGYLVPADAVPPPASAEAAAQFVNNSGPAGSSRPQ